MIWHSALIIIGFFRRLPNILAQRLLTYFNERLSRSTNRLRAERLTAGKFPPGLPASSARNQTGETQRAFELLTCLAFRFAELSLILDSRAFEALVRPHGRHPPRRPGFFLYVIFDVKRILRARLTAGRAPRYFINSRLSSL